MPVCAVLNCKKSTQLTFGLPKNQNIRQKWLKVIPYLKRNDRVCEKHFVIGDVIKEYMKYDNEGKIIAQVKNNYLINLKTTVS